MGTMLSFSMSLKDLEDLVGAILRKYDDFFTVFKITCNFVFLITFINPTME